MADDKIRIEENRLEYKEKDLQTTIDGIRFRKFAGNEEWQVTDFLKYEEMDKAKKAFEKLNEFLEKGMKNDNRN